MANQHPIYPDDLIPVDADGEDSEPDATAGAERDPNETTLPALQHVADSAHYEIPASTQMTATNAQIYELEGDTVFQSTSTGEPATDVPSIKQSAASSSLYDAMTHRVTQLRVNGEPHLNSSHVLQSDALPDSAASASTESSTDDQDRLSHISQAGSSASAIADRLRAEGPYDWNNPKRVDLQPESEFSWKRRCLGSAADAVAHARLRVYGALDHDELLSLPLSVEGMTEMMRNELVGELDCLSGAVEGLLQDIAIVRTRLATMGLMDHQELGMRDTSDAGQDSVNEKGREVHDGEVEEEHGHGELSD